MEITAVIPAYNYAHYLPRAIDSVLAQTHPVKELIVVDDGSTDNTREVVARYGDRVTYVYKDNAGLSAARNTGLRLARTDWVGFLDADDWWMPAKIQRQAEALAKDSRAVLSYTRILLVSESGSRSGRWVRSENLWPYLRYANPITPSTVVARRDVLLREGGFNEELRSCEDWDMWVRVREYGSFAGVEEPLTGYQLTPNSMSMNAQRMIDNMEKILEKTLLRGLSGIRRVIWRRRIRSAAVYFAAVTYRESGRLREAESSVLRSLALWPSPGFIPRRWWFLIRLRTHRSSKEQAIA